MILKISHKTAYEYSQQVPYGLQQLRMHPLSDQVQTVNDWQIHLQGGKTEAKFTDHNGNLVYLISYLEGTNALDLRCEGLVEINDTGGVYGKHTGPMPLWYYLRNSELTFPGPGITGLAKGATEFSDEPLAQLHFLSELIAQQISYRLKSSTTATTAEGALDAAEGVCQDHAHVFIAAARLLELPARYVSGYLMMEDRVDQDASHAWAEAYLPELGWVGFDVSNGISPDSRYVKIAVGLDYKEAAPISGVRFGAGDERLSVVLQVQQ